MRLLALL